MTLEEDYGWLDNILKKMKLTSLISFSPLMPVAQ
jgi:hypothetical protein